jgi:hypothetical protein
MIFAFATGRFWYKGGVQASVCSANSKASSTSIPKYITVLSSDSYGQVKAVLLVDSWFYDRLMLL